MKCLPLIHQPVELLRALTYLYVRPSWSYARRLFDIFQHHKLKSLTLSKVLLNPLRLQNEELNDWIKLYYQTLLDIRQYQVNRDGNQESTCIFLIIGLYKSVLRKREMNKNSVIKRHEINTVYERLMKKMYVRKQERMTTL